MRIRTYLLLVAAVILVPGFLAAGVAVKQVREAEREATLRGLRETVRATALLVDGEIQRSLGALGALGNSANLKSGDLRAFYDEAEAIDRKPGVWTLLLDETGRQVLNTAVPFGTPPPAAAAQARVARVLSTGKPLISDVIKGPVTGRLLTTLYVPAATVGERRYVVAQAFSVEHWQAQALQPRGRADWIVGVIDRAGNFVSRSHKTDEFLGRQARPELVAASAGASEGLIRHATLEGVDAYDAFAHSALTGWTIAVAAPVDSIDASATQAVAWLATGVAVALTIALGAAWLFSRGLISAIETASRSARALGRGEQPATAPTPLHEFATLNLALADAGQLLAAEHGQREAAEAERERLLESETRARQKAQELNAAKDQFLALLGHELRNPLAAISGASEVVARSRGDGAAPDRFVAIIQRQARHLAHIVDDLLEVSRMLSGKLRLALAPMDLADSVARCVEALAASEKAAGYRLRIDAQPAWVQGDPVRVEQIVNNLLGNAIKYSSDGSEVRVRVRSGDGVATIEVEDDGAGISPALLPTVFEPFVQGPAFPGRAPNGLGIGLALVRQLVELHGGRIVAQSAGEGRGSRFVVTLASVPVAAATATAVEATPTTRCRILLVEDNADARETMSELLGLMGYDVAVAGDGEAAIAALDGAGADVVIMDIGLPGRDGYQIAAELRSRHGAGAFRLIALTGYGQQRDRQFAAEAGFDDHLVKPIEPDVLVRAIDAQLQRLRDAS